MTTLFDGTLPLLPFHPNGMVGAVQSDGQRPHVAALACEPDGRVICLSLVGPATSVSSALAKLMDPNGRLFFEPNDGIDWTEPRILQRETGIAYRELSVHLRGTLAAHGLCLPLSAHLGDGLVHPPVIPRNSRLPRTRTAILRRRSNPQRRWTRSPACGPRWPRLDPATCLATGRRRPRTSAPFWACCVACVPCFSMRRPVPNQVP